jgi:hypothetical protein
VAEVGGEHVANWLDRAVASLEELDYTVALSWFGLRFMFPAGEPQQSPWQLQIDPTAGQQQIDRFHAWASGSGSA